MRYRIAVVCALMVVAAGSMASAQILTIPKEGAKALSDAPALNGFSVALVLGDMQGTSTPDNLPLGAKKAIADLRDFLPYKSYRLLDTQWIRCCGIPKAVQPQLSGRLRGLEEQLYAFVVDFGFSGPRISVHFSLRDDNAKKTTSTKSTDKEMALREQLAEARRQGYSSSHPTVKELELKLQQQLRDEAEDQYKGGPASSKGAMIDSTFSMDAGETVVIGTSSLKGDKALIALLTAVPRTGPQSSTQGEKR